MTEEMVSVAGWVDWKVAGGVGAGITGTDAGVEAGAGAEAGCGSVAVEGCDKGGVIELDRVRIGACEPVESEIEAVVVVTIPNLRISLLHRTQQSPLVAFYRLNPNHLSSEQHTWPSQCHGTRQIRIPLASMFLYR